MDTIRVLVVDDSIVFRSQIKAALDGVEGIEVVGVASNGKIALEKLAQTEVDLIILDLEMPQMDGLQTLEELKKRNIDVKVILFCSKTSRSASIALQALNCGAADFIMKPSGTNATLVEAKTQVQSELIPRIKQFSFKKHKTKNVEEIKSYSPPASTTHQYNKLENLKNFKPKIICIGSSTGGPNALEAIFNQISTPLDCPILIVQHMPPLFTESLAKRLAKISGMNVSEAKHGETVLPNRIYLAPGDFHMKIHKVANKNLIQLNQDPKRQYVRPCVDTLFESVAVVSGGQCMGFVLTGMGEDGLEGAHAIKKAGGGIMIQEGSTCVVNGMPGAIFQANIQDSVGNLSQIKEMIELMSNFTGRKISSPQAA